MPMMTVAPWKTREEGGRRGLQSARADAERKVVEI